MRWPSPVLTAVDRAIADARAGTPRVVAIEGEPGFGKTALIREVLGRLDGFRVLRAFGEESARDERHQVLREFCPEAPAPTHTLQAARLLGRLVDGSDAPVALVLDDLHWIDPDSVDALAALVQRAAGDRLLIVAGYRPLGQAHPAWRRVVGGPTITLDGLSDSAGADLVGPDAPDGLAEALRVHTGGSPLHMLALLREHSVAELASLAARGELPAPADLAAAVDARIAELSPDSAGLLRALAVLDDGWTDLPTAAAVGGVGDPETASRVLHDEHLLRVDRTDVVPRVRLVHAVVRAAVHDTLPVDVRRGLHGAAAARVADPGTRLRHRLGATAGPDEGLASDLDRHADDLHERRRFRQAARFRRLAAAAGSSDDARERRLLDADVESLLARETPPVLRNGDSAHHRLVRAFALTVGRRWVEAARELDDVSPSDVVALDPVNRYRFGVLRGWTVVASGRDPATALPVLEAAARSEVTDPAMRAFFTFAYGQARGAVTGRNDDVWGLDDTADLDRATLAATRDGLARLSLRGAIHALSGTTEKAIGDLSVVVDRIDDGRVDFGDGVMHALLGLAQWTAGEWRRSAITIGVARAGDTGPAHPIVAAVSPLAAVVTGDDPRPLLARSRAAQVAAPLRAAVHAGDIADVGTLGLTGTPAERRDWRARRIVDLGDPADQADGSVPYLWLLVHGIAAAWAGDADAVDGWADRLTGLDGGVWRAAGIDWLRALARRTLVGIPAFEAVLWADAAREEPSLRSHAEAALAAIGASRYAPALLPDAGQTPDDPLAPLSNREREVVALLLEGLSYTQIAKELYVTRSTVAFHLSNTYAKTGTTSRHELVQLVR
ncbi:MAG: hypothetical protein ABS81_13315 [Pseudonocardia sp. SCN 72-86]|nr:MAG: hypothetical protein ABS81_13315 [Pseudonocardia sp. SCN 72-86]